MRRLLPILAVLLLAPFAVPVVLGAFFFGDSAPTMAALPTPVTAAEKHAECLRLDREPPDYLTLDTEEWRKLMDRWSGICRDAHAAEPAHAAIALSFARVLMSQGGRAEALPIFKGLAAQDNVRALNEIFEFYRSWDRDVTKPRRVTRAEAEASLRRAAELGDAEAILALTLRLDRGGIVKRDAAEARLWAARLKPTKDWGLGFMQVTQARLLVKSENADERARGVWMLGELIKAGRADAKTHLARAIRSEDPVRARKLLEEAMRGDPGGASPPLADMLIKGEGGSVDPERAVKLLKWNQDVPGVRAAYGQLQLEGKLVPRNVKEAIERIAIGAQYSYDLKLQAAYLFADNPDASYSNASGFLFDMVEFFDAGEPGAVEALVALKLSTHPQFADRVGGCALVASAQQRGDDSLRAFADRCPPV